MKIGTIIVFLGLLLNFHGSIGQTSNGEKSLENNSKWSRLVPNQAKFQFAGSMGMFSVGPGLYYGKKTQLETDLYIGFIPRIDNMKGHITLTLKQTYTPFRIIINQAVSYEPLTGGLYINKIFGSYFWDKLPDRYPNNYYFWATNTRFNIFLGQALSYKMGENGSRNLSLFYEINTNDLYVISAYGNKMIDLMDIINISFGLRYRIFKDQRR